MTRSLPLLPELWLVLGLTTTACHAGGGKAENGAPSQAAARTDSARTGAVRPDSYPPGVGPNPVLPEPYATPSNVKSGDIVGWPSGSTPVAPAGFTVELYADSLESPRWLYVLPDGDVLVAESGYTKKDFSDLTPEDLQDLRSKRYIVDKANRITLLRDTNHDGRVDLRETFLEGVKQPLGMLLIGGWFYVAATDALLRYPYTAGELSIQGKGEKILDLPMQSPNRHWTRNVVAKPDGSKLYITVGSTTNVDEQGIDVKDPRRAAILEVNPDGSGMRVFASGLRNPVGMDWAPGTSTLWTVVNERDLLGDELVPDFLTSVKEGAFYGWPYAYFGAHEDPRKAGERPDLVAKAVAPDYGLGSHTASLGLLFYRGASFPEAYRKGAFISQHGSWNRSPFAGYKVIFVPFENGRPSGPPRDFLTGFIADEQEAKVHGRPVGLALLPDGSLLVSDDSSGKVWRVRTG